MKKLIFPAWIMAFLVIFQISCQDELDYYGSGLSPYEVDISSIMGSWTATQVEFKIGGASMDVSEHFTDFTITIYENRGCCSINTNDPMFAVKKWEKNGDSFYNVFSNPETNEVISVNVLEKNGGLMTASIKNLTPYVNKLFPDEDRDGYYLINFSIR